MQHIEARSGTLKLDIIILVVNLLLALSDSDSVLFYRSVFMLEVSYVLTTSCLWVDTQLLSDLKYTLKINRPWRNQTGLMLILTHDCFLYFGFKVTHCPAGQEVYDQEHRYQSCNFPFDLIEANSIEEFIMTMNWSKRKSKTNESFISGSQL